MEKFYSREHQSWGIVIIKTIYLVFLTVVKLIKSAEIHSDKVIILGKIIKKKEKMLNTILLGECLTLSLQIEHLTTTEWS